MAAVGLKGSLVLPVLCYLIWTVVAAPVDEGTSHALQISESMTEGRGCYYNFEHYGEGDRILTNEPCLNCTCHNRMLMCYLRVCPFTKAIGQDCTFEKKPDQCCPVITCPQVPVALLTSSTTSEAPQTTTALGRLDNYGCLLEDNTFYADGAQVPSDPRKPCELCYCIRNHTACVMQECTLNVEGCKPVYQEGVCCPVRYDCDYDDVATTPKPTIGLVTTPGGPSDCLLNSRIYRDGAMVMKDEKAPCKHCYCMRGDIVCIVQECGTPLEGTNCTPMEPKHGHCCPNYECTNGTYSTENYFGGLSSSTETLLESTVTEASTNEKPDSDESSNEASSNESSEESKEGSGSEVLKPVSEELPSNHNAQEVPTATEQSEVSNDSSVSSSDEQYTKQPDTNELVTSETPVQEPNNGQAGDSIPEATQDQDVTHPHQVSHDLGEDQGQDQDNTPKQSIPAEQEDETTQKQEVSQEQGATHKLEEVTQVPEPTHTQQPIHDHEDSTNAQEATHEQEVTQETPGSNAVKVQETVGDNDETHHQDTTENNVTPVQEEVTHSLGAVQEQETASVQDATHEQDVTPLQEEATNAPDVIHEQDSPIVQEAAHEQDVTHVQEEVTQLPEVTHEQDSPIVQEPAHKQGVTHVQEEVTQLPESAHEQDVTSVQEEATHAPDVTHEQDSPIVQEAAHEQDVTHLQEEATSVPNVIHEHDSPIVQEAAHEQDVTHVQDEVTQLPEVTHEQESPVVQEAAHEQAATQVVEEVTHTPEVTLAPQVSHEQETSIVPDATQEQVLDNKQGVSQDQEVVNVQETTNQPEAITEQATVKQEAQTQAPVEIVKDPQVTNEIPESTPPEHTESSTEEPTVEVARVPGEGSCLVDGKTYAHNSIISSENPCHEECRCYSSIVTCKSKECTPAPTQYEHCEPVITPGSCCPTYLCDQKPSDAPEAHSQLSEHTGDASHSDIPEEVANDSIGTTQASIESEHKDALQSGSDKNEVPAEKPEENNHQSDILTTEQTLISDDTSSSNNNGEENVNSHVVHDADAAIHGVQPEAMDNKPESGNKQQPSEDTTVIPTTPEKPEEETTETGISQEPETSNGGHTEEIPVKHDDEPMPTSDDVSSHIPLDVTSSPKPSEEESAPAQETTVGSEDSEKSHPEIPEGTVNNVPEVTTVPQVLQEETHDSTVPSADSVEAEGNNNYVTSSDSTIDESKHEESIVTIKPTEINFPQESEGANTEHDNLPTEGPVGIPDQSHSQFDDNPEQIQGAILFQQTTESESLQEASTEHTTVSGDPQVPSVSNEVPEENQHTVTEENVPPMTDSPNKPDSDAETNHVSSVNVESDESVTRIPDVTEQASPETTLKPSSEEASSSSSAYEKSTEPSANQVLGDANEGTSHSIEDTTDSVVQTTIRQEILPSVETSQDENKAQESDNVITSSTENEKPHDITTFPPIVNQDDSEKNDEKLENVTPHEKPELTSDENVHNDEVINHPEHVPTDEIDPEEKPTQESHEQDVGEHIAQDSSASETSTEEVKAEETQPQTPSESTDTPIHNDENIGLSDSSPHVIFEEVTVTGMPSIESHVTEGTVDHSVHITNDLQDNDIVDTTENTAPTKESSLSNEVQTSNEPVNTEAPLEPSVETEKNIINQLAEDNTASPVKDAHENVEEPHNDTTYGQQEINSSESTGELIPTTQKTSVEESHQGTVNTDESSPDTNEINPTQSVSSEQTTTAPITHDSNENSNDVILEESTSIPNNVAHTEQHEVPAPVSDDQKNNEAPLLETSSGTSDEPSETTGQANTEPAKVGSEHETTPIPLVETTHPAQETNVEDNTINQPHTDAPLEDEKVNPEDTEHNPTEVQTDNKEDSQVTHEESPVVSQEPTETIPTTDRILTNDPIQTVHETSQDETQTETSPEPNQNEVLHQETTEAPAQNQSENTSEEANHADESVNTVKETATDTLHVPAEVPSENTEMPSSDTKQQSHEVSTEHVIESEPEQNATPSSPSADHESSTAHETVISQTENILSPSPGSSDEIPQSSGNSHDSTTLTPQITHLEHAAPPAPDSDSHVLETNAGEGESATQATEQSTAAAQSTISDNNQSNEESHHDDVPQNPPETEPEQVPAEPEQASTEPEQVPAEPDHAPTEPEQVPAEPEHVPAEPEQVPAKPDHAPTEPEHVPVEPEHLPAEPEHIPAEPEHVPAEPEHVPTEPEHVPAEPEHVPAEPEQVPADPEHVSADPEHLPAEPEHIPAEPEHVPAEPEHVPTEPEHVPAEPEHLPAEPEHIPAEPEHVPAEPEHVPTEPEHVPAEPEHVPAEPEQMPAEPEQVPAEHEQTPAETEPTLTQPEQVPAGTEQPPSVPEQVPVESEQPIVNEPIPEDTIVPTTHIPELAETSPGFINHESSTVHPEIHSHASSSSEDITSSTEHPLTDEIQTTPKESIPETHKLETEKPAENIPVTESISIVPPVPDKPEEHVDSEQPDDQSSKVPSTHSTEAAPVYETTRPTYKPSVVHHEEAPSFPTWSQKPFEHHTTPEPHPPEDNHYPSGFDPEYEDEEGVSYGPGTCRYGGKVYLSAQQIPRDDPCDFCFCFRSDIICLQQSCPPPIRGCYQETIKGFCCPRYECHVSMATMLNMTTTTTTTTTTLPPHFLAHAYNGAATKAGCQVKDVAYSVGERIPSTSGPCLECRCGANGQMKCDPTVCGPQEALLRQVMDAAISRRR